MDERHLSWNTRVIAFAATILEQLRMLPDAYVNLIYRAIKEILDEEFARKLV